MGHTFKYFFWLKWDPCLLCKAFWWNTNPFGGTSLYAITCEYPHLACAGLLIKCRQGYPVIADKKKSCLHWKRPNHSLSYLTNFYLRYKRDDAQFSRTSVRWQYWTERKCKLSWYSILLHEIKLCLFDWILKRKGIVYTVS